MTDTPTRDQRAFVHGYLIAVANIMNLHRDEVIGKDVLSQLGSSNAEMMSLGLTDYDAEPLSKLFDILESRDD